MHLKFNTSDEVLLHDVEGRRQELKRALQLQ